MRNRGKSRLSVAIWLIILLFLATILTFPKWITVFYPQPHRDLVFSLAYEYDVDPYLVFAIIRAESKYQTNAESPVGARGLMQIMPETAMWIAEQQKIENFDVQDLHEPEVNIRLGTWYLANLSEEYQEVPLIVAAYNAGRGQVKNWIKEGIWDGDPEQIQNIPFSETREYVKSVLKNYEAYKAIYL